MLIQKKSNNSIKRLIKSNNRIFKKIIFNCFLGSLHSAPFNFFVQILNTIDINDAKRVVVLGE